MKTRCESLADTIGQLETKVESKEGMYLLKLLDVASSPKYFHTCMSTRCRDGIN